MKYDSEFFCKAKYNGVKEMTIPKEGLVDYIIFRGKMADMAGVPYDATENPQKYLDIIINLSGKEGQLKCF